ncbi:phosphatidylglycerophosphate phosphatase 1, chloroplastic/mitochondrial [Mercurialis annua]|uniref:phosphatidylglycerophosphate phosphatase 1, chloroplastic/mitochondrial n=1 Tax=Mercurialis annua TaxID=3986 RepID=UPI0021605A1C|nr:phosphatidylglycerophosphate phosphatase 1, chloroplastic/mitochondrial [Mercurialis annua]XP_050230013.1 phosphatidylglycerophosphate phosphatase 1, chloroplastic/mitochondrial [Mercurialis annua]XP_050230014.1 phosphatidylglycerophosphate phosphatase 1, chloroplastic/mitochondrial [Mercurialis annua]
MEMPCACVAPLPNCYCPILVPFNLHRRTLIKPNSVFQIHSNNFSLFTLHPTTNCISKHDNYHTSNNKNPTQIHSLINHFQCSIDNNSVNNKHPEPQNREKRFNNQEKPEPLTKKPQGLFTNMWWADLRAALGQRVNIEGIVSSVSMFVKEQHLALPHVSVRDIRYIDWEMLHQRGFRGVVFDKDNTITVPYTLNLCGYLQPSIEECKSVFGDDIAVFSNSAGLCEYDHDGSKALALEKAIGIKVIRHRVKKPAGTAEEIEKHFGCKSSQLIMVGDRPFTDVAYGNRNGFLTILTAPLSLTDEPFIVRQVRKLEMSFTNYWFRKGSRPVSHSLLPDAMQCIKDPPPL